MSDLNHYLSILEGLEVLAVRLTVLLLLLIALGKLIWAELGGNRR